MDPSPPQTGQRKAPDTRLGTVIAGRYRLVARIGAGGMGQVYEAEQLTTRRRVAVKLLLAGLGKIDVIRKRFEREALASSRLTHPNIVAVLDYGALDDGGLFLAMERVHGESLGDVLERGRLAPERALLVARQVLDALRHAHAAGVVHRDLKPDNVMIVDTGEKGAERDLVKLLDFGIAKLIGEVESEKASDKLTQAGVAFGTPEYMSPEQAMGEAIDARADLYAMGVMLFELLAGRRPFEADDKMTLLRMQVNRPPPTLAQVAPDATSSPLIEALLARAMAKKRDRRYSTADEMLIAFDAAAVDFLRPVEGWVVTRAESSTGLLPGREPGEAGRPGDPGAPDEADAEIAAIRAGATQADLPAPWRRPSVRRWAAAVVAAVVLVIAGWRMLPARTPLGAITVSGAQLALAHACAALADGRCTIDAYQAAVAAVPALAADAELRADVTALGSRARDGVLRSEARAAAEAWGFGTRIDWFDSYALDLTQGGTCKERRNAVPRLRALKDKRAIALLKKAGAREGGQNACLERDAREAIEFLEALP